MTLRRKSSGPLHSSTASPYIGPYVEVISKSPFKDIDGQPFCIWQYRISWSYETSSSEELYVQGASPPSIVSVKVGLLFSARIDIKRPDLYPESSVVQDTSVQRPANDDKQYVFQNVKLDKNVSAYTDIFFIAPCEEDLFTPVRLGAAEGGTWVEVPFRVDRKSPPCTTQVIRGPAITKAVCEGPPPPEPSPSPGPTPVPQPAPPPSPTPKPLTHSARTIRKATISTLSDLNARGPASNSATGEDALTKFSFGRRLLLQPGEVSAVRDHLLAAQGNAGGPAAGLTASDPMWRHFSLFEAGTSGADPYPRLGHFPRFRSQK